MIEFLEFVVLCGIFTAWVWLPELLAWWHNRHVIDLGEWPFLPDDSTDDMPEIDGIGGDK